MKNKYDKNILSQERGFNWGLYLSIKNNLTSAIYKLRSNFISYTKLFIFLYSQEI